MNPIEKKVFERLKIIAKQNAFEKCDKESISIYKNMGFTDCISCTITYFRGELNGAFFYTKYYNDIEKYLEVYYDRLDISHNKQHSTVFFSHRYVSLSNESLKERLNDIGQISIEDTPEGIAEFCDLLEYNIVEKMLPLAEKFNDIKYLEQRIRTSLKGKLLFPVFISKRAFVFTSCMIF